MIQLDSSLEKNRTAVESKRALSTRLIDDFGSKLYVSFFTRKRYPAEQNVRNFLII